MKTTVKIVTALATLVILAACTASAADPQTGWAPGWRHEQMMKARADGTFTPGAGPWWAGAGGPSQGRGQMAAAIGPDGKIDPARLPETCPYRQAVTK